MDEAGVMDLLSHPGIRRDTDVRGILPHHLQHDNNNKNTKRMPLRIATPPTTISFIRTVVLCLFGSSLSLVELTWAFPFSKVPVTIRHNRGFVGPLAYGRSHHAPCYYYSSSNKMTTTPSTSSPSDAEESTLAISSSLSLSSLLRTLYLLLGSTTSIVVAGTFFYFLATRRDALMVTFFMGAIANGILSKVMKRLLNQQRPPSSKNSIRGGDDSTTREQQQDKDNMVSLILLDKHQPSDHGMPSSHAMSLGFIGTFTMLNLLASSPPTTTAILIPLVLLFVGTSLVYRVETQLHSTDQIVVGLTLGSVNGWMWKQLCSSSNGGGSSSLTLGGMTLPSAHDYIQSLLTYLSPQDHLLPIPFLVIPALVGIFVVGSLERRIAALWKYYYSSRPKTE